MTGFPSRLKVMVAYLKAGLQVRTLLRLPKGHPRGCEGRLYGVDKGSQDSGNQ